MLKNISLDQKDPYYPWDHPEHMRNHNEVLHADNDFYGLERYSTGMITNLQFVCDSVH